MTRNQRRAVELAEGIVRGRVDPVALPDRHWQLLLLAAGMTHHCARPHVVARQVLRHLADRTGYFADARADVLIPEPPPSHEFLGTP